MNDNFLDRINSTSALLPIPNIIKFTTGIGFYLEYAVSIDSFAYSYKTPWFHHRYEIVSINPQKSTISYKLKRNNGTISQNI